MQFLGKVLDSLHISEEECSSCGNPFIPHLQGFLCDSCIKEIKPYHPIEYTEIPFIKGYRVFSLYDGALRELIRAVKFRRVKPLTGVLAGRIEAHFREYLREIEPHIISFVPVHFWRRWGRGFDQNEELLKTLGVPYLKVIERHRYARPLAGYGREKRLRITESSFRLRKSFIDMLEGKRVLILDDIITTGSTAHNVAKLLLEVGAEEVYFYFIAADK